MEDPIGSKLREARNRRRQSLDEVEAATKIRRRYLQAIEEEDWDELPGDTYARAFIRTYGRHLGLDGDRLAEEQRRSRGAPRPGERLPRLDPRPRPVRGRRGLSPRVVVAIVSVGALALLLAIGLSSDGGSGGEDASDPPPPRQARPHVGQAIPLR